MKDEVERYRINSIYTMTGAELVITLYDEMVKKLNQSKILIEHGDQDRANEYIDKVREIIKHLKITLEPGSDISDNLTSIYNFLNVELIKIKANKSGKGIDEVLDIIKELRDAWKEADKNVRTTKS